MSTDQPVSTDLPEQTRQYFRRRQRLTEPAQFRRVFSHNRRLGDAYFTILGHNTQQQPARLGLAISRKHVKRAVARNRLKRLIRESFRQHQVMLQGWDVVVMVKQDVTTLSNQQIIKLLEKHWLALTETNNK